MLLIFQTAGVLANHSALNLFTELKDENQEGAAGETIVNFS
jgi:hypothetical protein